MKIFEIVGQAVPDIRRVSINPLLAGDAPTADLGDETNEPFKGMPDVQDFQTSFLKKALDKGSIKQYEKAHYLEKYRDALVKHLEVLQDKINKEAEDTYRGLAPRIFGWHESEGMPSNWNKLRQRLQIRHGNAKDVFKTLRNLEIQSYPLEDPTVSTAFFDDLLQFLLSGYLNDIDPDIIRESYPQLYPYLYTDHNENLFKHKILEKKHKTKCISSPHINPPHAKFISQRKFEDYMAEKEAKDNYRPEFRANPIPASTLLPKYKELMNNKNTKSAELRIKHTKKLNSHNEEAFKIKFKKIFTKSARCRYTSVEDGKRKRDIIIGTFF